MAIRFLVENILLVANKEAAYQLPKGCKSLQVQSRTAAACNIASRKGSVEGSTAPGKYFTIKSGTVYKDDSLDVGDGEVWIYLAAGSALNIEVVCTYDDSIGGGAGA